MQETIGGRIKRLRLERGFTQRELTRGLDRVSYTYLSRVEADARVPSIRALREIAARLGVTVHYLETGRQPRSSEAAALKDAARSLEEILGLLSKAERRLGDLHLRLDTLASDLRR